LDSSAEVPVAPAESSAVPADVTFRVPPDAEIWVEGIKINSTGVVRDFQTPPLIPGNRYAYEVRARWNADGQEVVQTQEVLVTAGVHVTVSFPTPPAEIEP